MYHYLNGMENLESTRFIANLQTLHIDSLQMNHHLNSKSKIRNIRIERKKNIKYVQKDLLLNKYNKYLMITRTIY